MTERAPMSCTCPGGCREKYSIPADESDRFECVRCLRATPWCCGSDGEGIDAYLCDECWDERRRASEDV